MARCKSIPPPSPFRLVPVTRRRPAFASLATRSGEAPALSRSSTAETSPCRAHQNSAVVPPLPGASEIDGFPGFPGG